MRWVHHHSEVELVCIVVAEKDNFTINCVQLTLLVVHQSSSKKQLRGETKKCISKEAIKHKKVMSFLFTFFLD